MPFTLSLNTNPLVNRFAEPEDLIETIADKILSTLLAAFLAQSLASRALTWFPGSTERIRSPA